MKLTAELINSARIFLNPLQEREIDLRGRRIPAIENLGALKDQVDVLDLTDNDVERLENFPKLKRLKWIMLANNSVRRIQDGLYDSLPNLRVLVLANNRITLLSEIDKLKGFKQLELLNLEDNPVQQHKHYREYVLHVLPWLGILDLDRVRLAERRASQAIFSSAAGKQLVQSVQNQGAAMQGDVGAAGVVLSDAQKAIVKQALAAATSQEEIERIEKVLRAGLVPDAATLASLGVTSGADVPMADNHAAEPGAPPKVERARSQDAPVTRENEEDAPMTKEQEEGAPMSVTKEKEEEQNTQPPQPQPKQPQPPQSQRQPKQPKQQQPQPQPQVDTGTAEALAKEAQRQPKPDPPTNGAGGERKDAAVPAKKETEEEKTEATVGRADGDAEMQDASAAMEVDEGNDDAATRKAETQRVKGLKVVELRAELKARQLDTKGLKAVLQKRLLAALGLN